MAAVCLVIRRLTKADHARSLQVIRKSFATVARQFGLSRKNAPTHPSLLTAERFREMAARPVTLFGAFVAREQVGFAALERADRGVYYLERLSVLPKYRHRGYGCRLVDRAVAFARARGGTSVDTGLIDRHTVLKQWYAAQGFVETGTKDYPHLPFTVCFMRRELRAPPVQPGADPSSA